VSISDCLHGDLFIVFEEVELLTIDMEFQDGCVPAALGGLGCNVVDEKSKVFDFSGELGGESLAPVFVGLVGVFVRAENDRHG
jgi:hypothetical protein